MPLTSAVSRLASPAGGRGGVRYLRVAALALVLLLSGAALAQDEPQVLVGFDYRLYYWPEHTDRVETVAQAASEALPRLQRALDLELEERVDLYMAHTREEFEQLTGGSDPHHVLGQAFTHQRRIVLQPLEGESLARLVVHELTHVLLEDKVANTRAPIPRWLHEGLAKYASADFSPTDRMLLIEAINQGKMIPLEKLEEAFAGPPEKVSLAYAEAYTLVDFLANLQPTEGLAPFLRHLGQVGDVSRALLRAYQLTPEQLADQWREQIVREYLGRRNQESVTPIIWSAMVGLFVIAVLVRLRQAAIIRRRLVEEERLREGRQGETSSDRQQEEINHGPDLR